MEPKVQTQTKIKLKHMSKYIKSAETVELGCRYLLDIV